MLPLGLILFISFSFAQTGNPNPEVIAKFYIRQCVIRLEVKLAELGKFPLVDSCESKAFGSETVEKPQKIKLSEILWTKKRDDYIINAQTSALVWWTYDKTRNIHKGRSAKP
jgi:hypothetical protein